MPCIILDRDGVINEDSDDYIRGLSDWIPIPGSLAAIARLSRAGYDVIIATNQSGLDRGYFDQHTLDEIHNHLRQEIVARGGELAGIFYCPHLPDAGCDCRKPATGLLRQAEAALGKSLAGSWFIGDSLKDLQAARAHDCEPVLVTTGKGGSTRDALLAPSVKLFAPETVQVFANLAAAVDNLLVQSGE